MDRSSKATQPLTIPRPIQVVCKGSSPRNRQVGSRGQPDETFYVPQATRRVGAGRLPREPPKATSPATPGDIRRRFLAWILT